MNNDLINRKINELSKSKFRNSFHLSRKDALYIEEKGIDKIREHTKDFIIKRLSPKFIKNDGKQTPMRGHPTFIAQHATATCCRNCLYKWHHISNNKELNKEEIDYIVELIMTWTINEYKNILKNN